MYMQSYQNQLCYCQTKTLLIFILILIITVMIISVSLDTNLMISQNFIHMYMYMCISYVKELCVKYRYMYMYTQSLLCNRVFDKLICAPLSQRAYLVPHNSLFGPDGAVIDDYIVTNSINFLLVEVLTMAHTLTIVEPI